MNTLCMPSAHWRKAKQDACRSCGEPWFMEMVQLGWRRARGVGVRRRNGVIWRIVPLLNRGGRYVLGLLLFLLCAPPRLNCWIQVHVLVHLVVLHLGLVLVLALHLVHHVHHLLALQPRLRCLLLSNPRCISLLLIKRTQQ